MRFAPAGFGLPPQRRVFAAFFLYSFGFGGFYPRLAELQRMMDLREGALGLGLIGTATGTLISLTFFGPWSERLGPCRTLLALIPCVPAFFALAARAVGALSLFVCLLPAGLCIGTIEVVVNLEAGRVEHLMGRRIMNRSHAFWSPGLFTAGLMGSLAARLGISPQVHLALVVLICAILAGLLLGGMQAAPHRSGGNAAAPGFACPTMAILALVALSLAAQLLEAAGLDWSALYMRDVFGYPAYIGASAITLVALAQAATRYFLDPPVERHTPIVIARLLLGVLGAGCVAVTFATAPWVALAGFALIGAGTSALLPLAMSAAAQRTDRPAQVNVAALAQTSFVIFLLAPPLLGFVAQHWGVRSAYGIGLPLLVLGFLATPAPAQTPRPAATETV
jgi:MFS family permease